MATHEPVPKYDIEPVIRHYGGDPPPPGSRYKMRCFLPGHEDRNPSATVSYEHQRFTCWVCGVNEDAIGLVMLVDGLDFQSAREETERLSTASNTGVSRKRRSRTTLFGKSWTD